MIRMLHLADLHLGWTPMFLGELAPARQAERDRLLTRAVDLVLDEEPVDVVIIAGDLFETHTPPVPLVESVLYDLRRLVAGGIHVVTVPGNHDEITYPDSVYRRWGDQWPGLLIQNPMPGHVASLDIEATRLHVYGLAYTGGVTALPLSDFPRLDEPGFHVAVFHGSLDWNAGDRSLPLSSAQLAPARYDYIALGHIHQHHVRPIGPGQAVYAGATEGKGFSDPGTGQLCFVTLGQGGPQVTTRPLAVRKIREKTVDVTDVEDVEGVVARLAPRADGEAIVRVRLVGVAPPSMSADGVAARLQPLYYYVEVVDDTARLDDGMVEAFAREPTVRGQFVRRMQAGLATAKDEDERAVWHGALRRGLAAMEGRGT